MSERKRETLCVCVCVTLRERETEGERECVFERVGARERKNMLTWPQMLICNGGELVGGPTGSCGKCAGGPLDCGLCCGGGLYPTLDPPTFP